MPEKKERTKERKKRRVERRRGRKLKTADLNGGF